MYKLLIADDEPLERDTLEMFIKQSKLPITCIKVKNGKEAVNEVLNAPNAEPIQIVFLDIQMPILSGLEAAEIIHLEKPDVIIVFLTAWGVFDLAQQAIRSGAQDYLVKPVKRETIIQVLQKMIEKLEFGIIRADAEKQLANTTVLKEDSLRRTRVALVESIINGNEKEAQQIAHKIIQVYKDSEKPQERLKEFTSALLKTIESHIISCSFIEQQTNTFSQTKDFLLSVVKQACTVIVEEKNSKYERFIFETCKYISNHYSENFEIDQFAKQLDITPYYFSKLFKTYVGASFIEYIRTIRLAEAKKMLRENISVNETSTKVGYSDTAYFSRIFKAEFGVSPKNYQT